jgi:orotate phosphoribosyltransferase
MNDLEFTRNNIINKAIKFGEGVGQKKNIVRWIFDNREILLHPETLSQVSRLIWDTIRKYNPTVIAGLELAAIPLVIGVAQEAYKEGYTNIRSIIIRKKPKEYGRLRKLEGESIRVDDRVAVIDDIVSSGKSLMDAVKSLRNTPGDIVAAATLINFKRKGEVAIRSTGIPFEYIFNLIDMGMKYIDTWENELDIQLKWKTKVNNTSNRMLEGGPLIYKDKIYVPTDRWTFMILDMDGNIIQEFPLTEDQWKKGSRSVPVVYNDKVYFGAYGGGLYIFDIATDSLTNPDIPGLVRMHSAPVIIDDKIITTYETDDKPGGGIFCIDTDTLNTNWHFKAENYVVPPPTYIKDMNAVIFGSNDFRIYCIDISSGKVLWQLYTGGEVKAAITYEHGRCYAVSFNGYIYCLNANDGSLVWKRKLGHRIFFNPIIAKDYIYVGSDSHKFFALNKDTGNIVWIASFNKWCQGGACLYKDLIFVGSADNYVYALDQNTGKIKWRYKTEDEVSCFLMIANDCLYVTSWDGYLYCFDLMKLYKTQ